jgi:hypothetical protein
MNLKTLLPALLASLIIGLAVGCSDDKPQQPQPVAKKEAFNPFDHSKDEKITKSDKEEFEKAFAEKCIKDETSANPEMDRQKLEHSCNCIATYLMKDLTAKEAEKFVDEHENPVSLTFKENAAAYHCLQENAPPKDSGFSHSAIQQ